MAKDTFRRDFTLIATGTVLFFAGVIGYGFWADSTAARPFDAEEYLQKSLVTAATNAPGAQVGQLLAEGVDVDGKVHTEARGHLVVRFRSQSPQSASEPPPMLGLPHPAGMGCPGGEVSTHLRGGSMGKGRQLVHEFRPGTRPTCGPTVGPPPRCTFKQIWQKAVAKGAPHPAYADIDLDTETGTGDGKVAYRWRFEIVDRHTDSPDTVAFHAEFDDDC